MDAVIVPLHSLHICSNQNTEASSSDQSFCSYAEAKTNSTSKSIQPEALTFIHVKLTMFVVVEQDLLLVRSGHKDDLVPQSLKTDNVFSCDAATCLICILGSLE